MRTIKYTTLFKRDRKKHKKGTYSSILKQDFNKIVKSLAEDQRLESKYRDHALKGEYQNHRECHIRPNLLLIYRKDDARHSLVLVRLGTHSELF